MYGRLASLRTVCRARFQRIALSYNPLPMSWQQYGRRQGHFSAKTPFSFPDGGLYGFLSGLRKQCKPPAGAGQGKTPQIRLFRAAEPL